MNTTNEDARHTVLITGGNRGLGFATAQKLVEQGHRVFITARDLQAGQRAAAALNKARPDAEVEALELDLASLASVRDFAARWKATGRAIHRLVLNAGVIGTSGPRRETKDGFELQLGTNHLGHFLLTELLLDEVKAGRGRVVVVSSTMHIAGTGPGKGPDFDFDDLMGKRRYDGVMFYRNSKLANVWFTYELARRLEGTGVTVNALCPGFVPATQLDVLKGFQRFLFKHVMQRLPMARTVEQAATHIAWVTTSPDLDGQSGKFFADQHEIRSSDESYDVTKAARLWRVSEDLTGLAPAAEAAA